METNLLPLGWDPDDPGTWRFTSDALAAMPGRQPPVIARREVVTGAHEFGHAADPDILLGMPAHVAASWWVAVLGPIHRVRLAAIGYRAAGGTVLLGERPGWERAEGNLAVPGDPAFPDAVAARAYAARAFLAVIDEDDDDDG